LNNAMIKREPAQIIIGVASMVVGLLLMVINGLSLTIVVLAAGICFLAAGIYDLSAYIRFKDEQLYEKDVLFSSIISILVGLLFCLHPVVLGNVVLWVIIIGLAGFGAWQVFQGRNARLQGVGGWMWSILIGALCIIGAIILIIVPNLFGIIIGILVLLRGLLVLLFGASANNAFR